MVFGRNDIGRNVIGRNVFGRIVLHPFIYLNIYEYQMSFLIKLVPNLYNTWWKSLTRTEGKQKKKKKKKKEKKKKHLVW